MKRSFRFQLRPTEKQKMALTEMLEDHRQLYNAALQERRDAYRSHKIGIRWFDQCNQLKYIREADREGQGRWAYISQQATLRRVDVNMIGFFRRVKAGEKAGYPRFRGRGFDSVTWPRVNKAWDSQPHQPSTRVYLQGVGHVKVNQHRAVEGEIKTMSVKREGRRWYISLQCDNVPEKPLPKTGAAVGIDMGIDYFLTTSDGDRVKNERFGAAANAQIAYRQQAVERSKRGSHRRRKKVNLVTEAYRKTKRQRADHAHKVALALVRDNDVIVREDLRLVNITKSAKGTLEKPGRSVSGKTGLNRVIRDAAWGGFFLILADKAESAGRTVVKVNARNTSRTCSRCGDCAAVNRIRRKFHCRVCDYQSAADVNAAINILRAGLALQDAPAA